MTRRALFRAESVAYQTKKIYGSVCINVPVHYRVVTGGFGLLLIGFLVFSIVTDYAEQYVVKGFLNAKSGIVHVYPIRDGIIRKCFVKLGQRVKQGDILYSVDTSYDDFSQKQSREYQALQKRKIVIERDIAIKKKQIKAIKPLLKKHYISSTAYQVFQEALGILEMKRRDQDMALIRYQRSRTYNILAPITGEVSSIEYDMGQVLHLSKSVLTIVPQNAELIAQLYIPVSKSGFLNQFSPLAIRYDAYPYQHFGVATGHIVSVTHSILSDRDEDKPIDIGEPYYKAVAQLDKQTMLLYGKQHRLQQGMTCSVLISGVHKKLWQWMLDPIYRFSGVS